ncbi:DUF1156 domain-containing protein [uncultured Thiodictyon sp.]|uniref:DUF1156 domain-containing protein n=1 Tax=uncultured Thiodictyon sp. TaxID=1846217 RepID=UPI0025D5742F|nr:DUF1156 domain-containing protein [uncultured Thiodictyon sp.]
MTGDTPEIVPFALKDAPALIERLLPVQKLSAEAYKEQMAVHGKTLTALGSYWKGRKPLILNKACILGCLLPATEDPARDLEIFEKLMAMDDESFVVRWKRRPKPKEVLAELSIDWIDAFFTVDPPGALPNSAPVDWSDPAYKGVKVAWRADLTEMERRRLEVQMLPDLTYRERVDQARRPEEVMETVHEHIWGAVNAHLGTHAGSFPELVEQLGILRFGHRPRVADTFCGSGQIPFEAARLGCDVYAFNKRYNIEIRCGVTDRALKTAESGTVGRDSKYDEAYLIHQVAGVTYKTKISTLRGDYSKPDGSIGNRLRPWEGQDFIPRPDDLLRERLYCIEWMRAKETRKGFDYQFRSVTPEDLEREASVTSYVTKRIANWQAKGWIPDMRIEVGGAPRFQGLDLIKARGWTHWQNVFNPRQLLVNGLAAKNSKTGLAFGLTQLLNNNCRLSRWHPGGGGGGLTVGAFDNQAINALFNYGCRASRYAASFLGQKYKLFPTLDSIRFSVKSIAANQINTESDICITDPPYGDAVKYEEILDFFIAWLRKNPPPEFAEWTWDSRRSMAIQGEGESFRRQMVSAYKRMADCMPENGIQVVMFTHQSGTIWADMANVVWASGLCVTAAWYVATETDSALREGSHVKGTVLLVLRKRAGQHKTTRADLAWELKDEVEAQVEALTGLNQQAKGLYRDENVFEDADIQMAGYAAALRVLTRYAVIDGKDMAAEAIRPRVKGEITFVDGLIAFAVDTANQCLVPKGIPRATWGRLTGAERFYLKMLDLEARGAHALDNYQNFAKAFKVRDFHALMASRKANEARLKGAVELGRAEMGEGSELHQSALRAILYAIMELARNLDSDEVMRHLTLNIPDWYGDATRRDLAGELAGYLAEQLKTLRPDEASAARVLRELVLNQRIG